MVMFSVLQRFRVRDEGGATARVHDLAIDLSSGDYPPVTHLVVRTRLKRRTLTWDTVTGIDWDEHRIQVQALSGTDDDLHDEVLLDRDVLDALVLDVPNRQTMRANDLWLEPEANQLTLCAADIGAWAVIRRLGRGVLGHDSHGHLLDWANVEFLRGDPRAARAGGDYHRRVTGLQPPDIARLLDAMPYLHAAELLELLDEELAADTLELMRSERQVQVFEEFELERRVSLLQLMAPDIAADLLGAVAPEEARLCLEALQTTHRERLIELLRYPVHTAGGIMTNDIIVIEADQTIGQARGQMRAELARPDFVYYVFAVDDLESRRLQGVLTLRDMLVSDEHASVQQVMRRALDVLDPLMPAEAAARRVADEHLAALPVVNKDGRVLGVITADTALLVLAPASLTDTVPRVFS